MTTTRLGVSANHRPLALISARSAKVGAWRQLLSANAALMVWPMAANKAADKISAARPGVGARDCGRNPPCCVNTPL